MFSLFRKEAIDYFSKEDKEKIKAAIEAAEKNTSGEIRVFVEHYCKHNDPIHRAKEVFHSLKMNETFNRNAVLLYIAIQHKKMAIYADAGIYVKMDKVFWENALQTMQAHFKRENFAHGILEAIHIIGEALAEHFPIGEGVIKNDLPDDLVFGKNNR